jgi:ATPase subunit of ABC transporter with duplicated ATPase domains
MAYRTPYSKDTTGLSPLVLGSLSMISKDEYNKNVALLCSVCRAIENKNDLNYFKENPDLREWWQKNKEEERKQREEERKQREESKKILKTIKKNKKSYLKYMLDSTIGAQDRDYFRGRLQEVNKEEEEIYKKFPDLRTGN